MANNNIVYMHINIFNNKRYIGQTHQDPNDRWKNGNGYLNKNKNGSYRQPLFARAISRYGWDNFEHIIVCEELSSYEANKLEKELIAKYKTTDPRYGYNIKDGGDKCPMSNESKKKISKALKEYYKDHKGTFYGKHHSDESKRKIKESNSGSNNRWYGKTGWMIGKSGDKHPCYNRKHTNEEKELMSKNRKGKCVGSSNPRSKKVVQLTKDGEFIDMYETMSLAEKKTGVKYPNIWKVCHGKQELAKGFRWMFYDDYIDMVGGIYG